MSDGGKLSPRSRATAWFGAGQIVAGMPANCVSVAAVNMAGGHQTRAWMPPQNVAERRGVAQILHVHVPDAGDEGRVVQEDQRRPR